MNFSRLNELIYAYLGFRSVKRNAETDAAAAECVKELEKLSHFRYTYKFFAEPPAFLQKQPYEDYLKGSGGLIISVMTLGAEVDRRIKYYGRADAAKAVMFDACASAYLEELSDEYEKSLGMDLSYRFCPGYGGSGVDDLKYIFGILKTEKTGVSLTDASYMLPSKSMAGIVAVGKRIKKACGDCVIAEHCGYRKEGKTCYAPEKK